MNGIRTTKYRQTPCSMILERAVASPRCILGVGQSRRSVDVNRARDRSTYHISRPPTTGCPSAKKLEIEKLYGYKFQFSMKKTIQNLTIWLIAFLMTVVPSGLMSERSGIEVTSNSLCSFLNGSVVSITISNEYVHGVLFSQLIIRFWSHRWFVSHSPVKVNVAMKVSKSLHGVRSTLILLWDYDHLR